MMRFRVLGAVEATHSDHPVDLGHARVRCVLAVLLVEANRVVSADQLIERAWGQNPPRRRNVLYTYISQLRTVFSADPEVTIQRRAGGYQLAVDEESVDLHRFRSLITDARTTTEDAHAMASFDQALHLWRDAAFADLDTPWLAAQRAALELERQAAQLDRTDTALRYGHHAQLLAQLSTQATQQPFDERIAGQFMLALAGAGRPADALAAYQHTRHNLIDQLGLEPGPELRQLHERILAGDTEPAPPPRTQPTSPAARLNLVVPHQMPAATRHFTGRQTELDTLVGALGATDGAGGTVVISAVEGMAGIGKTALAVHAAHQLADRFTDGVLFADLHGFTPDAEPTPPELVLDRLLRGLGVPGPQIPPDLEARVGLYRSVLARRRVLIVLDNAAHETQLTPLIPATPSCRMIVTSRRHLAGLDDATHLTLPVLTTADATNLFYGLAGDRATPTDRPIIDQIVTLCGQLPLALRITAARLRLAPAATPAQLCAELEHALETGQGLDWLADGHRAVAAALAVSYRHLPPDQQHALRLAGLHPGPTLEPYALAALADTTVDHARQLLDDLHTASVLYQPAYRRYTLHDLVAAYATARAAELPKPERHTALDRLRDHYAATSTQAMNLTRPWEADQRPRPPATDTPIPTLSARGEAQAWLDSETDNLLATAHHAAGRRADHTLHQSATLRRHFATRGHYGQAVLLHEKALAIARETSNAGAEQDALRGLGYVHYVQSRFTTAADYFEGALAIARQTGNDSAEQDALHDLGYVQLLQGRYGPANDYLERALSGARRTGNHGGEQAALRGLGYLHYVQSRYTTAANCFQRALAIARQTRNDPAEQDALRGLGVVHFMQGRYTSAEECLERALTIARQTGNLAAEQNALIGLGQVHSMQDRYGQATDCFEQALATARQTGNRTSEQGALYGLGHIHRMQDKYEQAIDCFEQAHVIALDTRDRMGQYEAHQGLGRVNCATGHHDDALHHHQTALQVALDLAQPAEQARAHDGLAHTHHALTNLPQARHHWQTALDLLTGTGTDHTEEPGFTTTAIRTHLDDLDNQSTSQNPQPN